MLIILVTTTLAVLFGLAWHNEPARQDQSERAPTDDKTQRTPPMAFRQKGS
jgi:hypothetical protein